MDWEWLFCAYGLGFLTGVILMVILQSIMLKRKLRSRDPKELDFKPDFPRPKGEPDIPRRPPKLEPGGFSPGAYVKRCDCGGLIGVYGTVETGRKCPICGHGVVTSIACLDCGTHLSCIERKQRQPEERMGCSSFSRSDLDRYKKKNDCPFNTGDHGCWSWGSGTPLVYKKDCSYQQYLECPILDHYPDNESIYEWVKWLEKEGLVWVRGREV